MAKYSSGWFRLHNQHVGFARTFAPRTPIPSSPTPTARPSDRNAMSPGPSEPSESASLSASSLACPVAPAVTRPRNFRYDLSFRKSASVGLRRHAMAHDWIADRNTLHDDVFLLRSVESPGSLEGPCGRSSP